MPYMDPMGLDFWDTWGIFQGPKNQISKLVVWRSQNPDRVKPLFVWKVRWSQCSIKLLMVQKFILAVEVGSLFHDFIKFYTQVVIARFLNHQQYRFECILICSPNAFPLNAAEVSGSSWHGLLTRLFCWAQMASWAVWKPKNTYELPVFLGGFVVG